MTRGRFLASCIFKCGGHWAYCLSEYGPAATVYNRWNRWGRRGIWTRILAALTEEGWIAETSPIDNSYIKAHRGAGGGQMGRASQDHWDLAWGLSVSVKKGVY